MRKLVRVLIYAMLALVAIIVAMMLISAQKLPDVQPSKDGDLLAQKMLKAINVKAWDKVKYLSFTFRDRNNYIWDKQNNLAIISWDDYKVLINLAKIEGIVYKNNVQLEGAEHKENLAKAWAKWCNDSFWMFAPYKVLDPGTERRDRKSVV